MFVQYCCTFYGSQTWALGHKKLNLLCTAYNRSLRRVWKIPWHSQTTIVHNLSGRAALIDQLSCRFINMYVSMYSSDNSLLRFIAVRSLYDKSCLIGKNVDFVRQRCNISDLHVDIEDWHDLCVKQLKDNTLYDDCSTSVINELCDIADGLLTSNLTCDEAREFANYLCTM